MGYPKPLRVCKDNFITLSDYFETPIYEAWKEKFMDYAGEPLIKAGYEKDDDWVNQTE